MTARRGDYGVDAPMVPAVLGLAGVAGVAAAIVFAQWGFAVAGIFFLLSAAGYLYTTRRGKFVAWSDVLDGLALRGDERLLDMGCGRGAVLLLAAERLDRGRAVGVDLWRGVDQSGNAEAATLANAEAEGVAGRVELRTGDMTSLPFDDGEFAVVVSSLAIHNIASADGRRAAIDEAVRVLAPGGRLAVADIRHARDYAERLTALGLVPEVRGLGPRFWYGGPWVATTLVTATRPAG